MAYSSDGFSESTGISANHFYKIGDVVIESVHKLPPFCDAVRGVWCHVTEIDEINKQVPSVPELRLYVHRFREDGTTWRYY